MRQLLKILIIVFLFSSCGQNSNKEKELELKEKELTLKQKELELKEKVVNNYKDTMKKATTVISPTMEKKAATSPPIVKLSPKEEKWQVFFKNFKEAFNKKDRQKVKELTANNFMTYDGENIDQWLQSTAFSSGYPAIKKGLANGVRKKGTYDHYISASNYGGLFFDYKNGNWQLALAGGE